MKELIANAIKQLLDNIKHWMTYGGAIVAWFHGFFDATVAYMDNHAGFIGGACAIIGVLIQLVQFFSKRSSKHADD